MYKLEREGGGSSMLKRHKHTSQRTVGRPVAGVGGLVVVINGRLALSSLIGFLGGHCEGRTRQQLVARDETMSVVITE